MKLTSLPNWQLSTTILGSVRAALSLGQYRVLGGVIQEVPSAVQEEQVIRLLVPLNLPNTATPSDSGTFTTQLPHTSDLITTSQVLQWVTDMMAVTRLNATTITLDLPTIYQELTRFAQQDEIKEVLTQFHDLLEGIKRAELRITIHELLDVDKETTLKSHQKALERTRQLLLQMIKQARALLERANTIQSAMQMEAYFTWIALAQARCTAELGRLDVAYRELKTNISFWVQQSERIAHDLLLGEHPERFLFSDFVTDIPIMSLIKWLDFAHKEKKGVLWLDDLRSRTASWYKKEQIKGRMSNQQRRELKQDKLIVIPTMQKLIAKEIIMRGYLAQYQLFQEHNVMIAPLQKEIESVAKGDIVILEPIGN